MPRASHLPTATHTSPKAAVSTKQCRDWVVRVTSFSSNMYSEDSGLLPRARYTQPALLSALKTILNSGRPQQAERDRASILSWAACDSDFEGVRRLHPSAPAPTSTSVFLRWPRLLSLSAPRPQPLGARQDRRALPACTGTKDSEGTREKPSALTSCSESQRPTQRRWRAARDGSYTAPPTPPRALLRASADA